MRNITFEFDVVRCVKSGDGYHTGHYYAVVGWNNGMHVLREDEFGNIHEVICFNGGIGIGHINAADNSGAPCFDYMIDDRFDTI